MKKEKSRHIHLMKNECRINSEWTVPGCTEYTETPEPEGGVPLREGKTGLNVAEGPKRAEDMNKHCPGSNPSSTTHKLCDPGQALDAVTQFLHL